MPRLLAVALILVAATTLQAGDFTASATIAPTAVFTPPPCSSAPFGDVSAASPFCKFIQQLVADQITAGCGGGNYCPGAAVTREQMAVFLEVAMRGSATWNPKDAVFKKILFVQGNDTAIANGAALIAAINFARNNAAQTSGYLVKLEPGVYDVGTTSLILGPYVDVEGSGQNVTIVDGDGVSTAVAGVFTGAANSELRNLTVTASGGTYAIAYYAAGGVDASGKLSNVTLKGSGATGNVTVLFADGGAPTLSECTIVATGGSVNSFGISSRGTGVTVRNSSITATAFGASAASHDIYAYDGADVTISDSQLSSSAVHFAYGVLAASTASADIGGTRVAINSPKHAVGIMGDLTLDDIEVKLEGYDFNQGTTTRFGVDAGSLSMRNSKISGDQGSTGARITTSGTIDGSKLYGDLAGLEINTPGGFPVHVRSSHLSGFRGVIARNFTDVSIGATHLDGANAPMFKDGATIWVACVGSYNRLFTALNSICE